MSEPQHPPEVQQLLSEVADILEDTPSWILDEWEREQYEKK